MSCIPHLIVPSHIIFFLFVITAHYLLKVLVFFAACKIIFDGNVVKLVRQMSGSNGQVFKHHLVALLLLGKALMAIFHA